MTVRIFGVQAEADLGLWAYMKVMLRMVMTMFTILPIATNTTIGTLNSIMKHISLYGHKNLLKCPQCHSHPQIFLKPLKGLHCFQFPFCLHQRRMTLSLLLRRSIWRDLMLLGTLILLPQRRMVDSSWRRSQR